MNCSPCDSGSVPFFDRWAIAEPRPVWSHASTGLLGAIAAVTWWDLAKHDPASRLRWLPSYLLSRVAPSRTARVGAIAAATAAALRVASARHFPSDVVGGAAVEVGSAVLVHSIRF